MAEPEQPSDKMDYVWAIPRNLALDPVHEQLLSLVGRCSGALGEGFDECKAALELQRKVRPAQVHLLRLLLDSCHLTSESILLLVGNRKFWDADALVRSVVEGTAKFAYLCYGNADEVEAKVREFDELLPIASELRRHERACAFMAAVDDPENPEWLPFKELVLSAARVDELRKKLPPTVRKALSQKWSFSGLLREFTNSGPPFLKFASHLLYGYGMSSHVLHQDSDGVGMIWERNNRDAVRREAVELAHAARILSDLITMTTLRHTVIYRCLLELPRPKPGAEPKLAEIGRELKMLNQYFNAVEYGASADAVQE